MAYSELIKKFESVRNYMRQFLVYGFHSRDGYAKRSARSYDNEKRRIESWLYDYMSFRQEPSGKIVYLSIDSRHVPNNPLYNAWKASSFTKNDIFLHFFLLDILAGNQPITLSEMIDKMDLEYFDMFSNPQPIDESTVRKKIQEYTNLGLISAQKDGKQMMYTLSKSLVPIDTWKNALLFFSQENSLGIIGSYILDNYDVFEPFFSFKHRYLLFTLDSEIMETILMGIREKRKIEIETIGKNNKKSVVIPLKIFVSVESGRQYVATTTIEKMQIRFFRLDTIVKVKLFEPVFDYQSYQDFLVKSKKHIWGVVATQRKPEHIELEIYVSENENFIVQRLEREKRCGEIEKISENIWKFSADVYSAQEILPWLRTFIGRIISFTCSNKKIEKQFWLDFEAIVDQYKGEKNAV